MLAGSDRMVATNACPDNVARRQKSDQEALGILLQLALQGCDQDLCQPQGFCMSMMLPLKIVFSNTVSSMDCLIHDWIEKISRPTQTNSGLSELRHGPSRKGHLFKPRTESCSTGLATGRLPWQTWGTCSSLELIGYLFFLGPARVLHSFESLWMKPLVLR